MSAPVGTMQQRMATNRRSTNLIASHPGNTNAVRHGVFSNRALEPEIAARKEELRALPWCQPVDEIAVDEVARLLVRIAAIDRDLAERGHFGRNGARVLLDQRIRMSGQLMRWLKALGGLPSERAAWAAQLAQPSYVERLETKLAQIKEDEDGT